MKNLFKMSLVLMAVFVAITFSSCSKEETAPTVRFLAEVDAIDSYTVDITLESTDATSFAWSYGDGSTSTESVSHSHTYAASGEYTISVVATGKGGEATSSAEVVIVASIEEIIAGTGETGKTWVLTQAEGSYSGKIGVGPVDNTLPFLPGQDLIPSGIMEMFGLGAEYTDEFTFYKDGTFKIGLINDQALAGIIYGELTQTIVATSTDPASLPFCAVSYQDITGSWALSYDNLVVNAFNEFSTGVVEDVTFTFGESSNVANLVLSAGAYVGVKDLYYPVIPELGITEPINNSFYIIKEVNTNYMRIAIGMNGVPFLNADGSPSYQPTEYPIFMKPTMIMQLVLVPKAN
jgi:PKD repeat protein